jgi:hypothetical protein
MQGARILTADKPGPECCSSNPANLVQPHAFTCARVTEREPQVQLVFSAGLPPDHVRDGAQTRASKCLRCTRCK